MSQTGCGAIELSAGGRTRTRTLDPLIKRLIFSQRTRWPTLKPGDFRSIDSQYLLEIDQTGSPPASRYEGLRLLKEGREISDTHKHAGSHEGSRAVLPFAASRVW